MSSRRLALAALLVALVASLACKTVRPYEREHLAKPIMSLDPDPGQFALQQHVLGTREGSVGGFGGGGGGCGCN